MIVHADTYLHVFIYYLDTAVSLDLSSIKYIGFDIYQKYDTKQCPDKRRGICWTGYV